MDEKSLWYLKHVDSVSAAELLFRERGRERKRRRKLVDERVENGKGIKKRSLSPTAAAGTKRRLSLCKEMSPYVICVSRVL